MIADLLARSRALVQACSGSTVEIAGGRVRIPGPRSIRLSVVAGNIRVQRLIDTVSRGATIVDVGANIGFNTVYAARRVGPAGRVIAIEPAADNLSVLHENIAANALENVEVLAVAAGRAHEVRTLFLRGGHSAVNSLFEPSVYGAVTGATPVRVAPLDDLVPGAADLVKIDVEGAEIDVLLGMARLLQNASIQVIAEWHPRLQEAAGYAPYALPRLLLAQGFTLLAASHTRIAPLVSSAIDRMAVKLSRTGRPVELVDAARGCRLAPVFGPRRSGASTAVRAG